MYTHISNVHVFENLSLLEVRKFDSPLVCSSEFFPFLRLVSVKILLFPVLVVQGHVNHFPLIVETHGYDMT